MRASLPEGVDMVKGLVSIVAAAELFANGLTSPATRAP